jgi:DNA-binding PadR family transcriptional regulator
MKRLTINEQIFLIATYHLKDDAYGVKIRKKIIELTGSSILYGTLYNTLDSLVKKGYVSTRKGEPTSQRGGQNKVYYSLTNDGLAALQKARELQDSLWVGLPKVLYSEIHR